MKCVECPWCIKSVKEILVDYYTRKEAQFYCGYPGVEYELNYNDIMDKTKPYGCAYEVH